MCDELNDVEAEHFNQEFKIKEMKTLKEELVPRLKADLELAR